MRLAKPRIEPLADKDRDADQRELRDLAAGL